MVNDLEPEKRKSAGEAGLIKRRNSLWFKAFLSYLQDVHSLSADSVRRYWYYLRWLLLRIQQTLLTKAAEIEPPFGRFVSQVIDTLGRRKTVSQLTKTQTKIIETTASIFPWAKMDEPRAFLGLPSTGPAT
jgi:hypothetical protein